MPASSQPISDPTIESTMSTEGFKEMEYLDAFSSLEREERRDQARAIYRDFQEAQNELTEAREEIRRQRIRIQELETQQYLLEQEIQPQTFRASEAS